jgi:hypothetical protein
VYFFDPAGNVVEYIARHDLANPAPGGFSSADILCVSEIGLIVDDVIAVADSLKGVVGLSSYRGASDLFTALGDEMGLLLVMKRGRFLNFDPSTDEKAARVYPTAATVGAPGAATHRIAGFPYVLTLEK